MELGNNIHLVKGFPWAGNIYIIDEKPMGVTLIDTGMPYKLNSLERELGKINKRIEDITLILHTHGHIDHTGNTAKIKERSNAVAYGHKLDESHFDQAHKYNGVKNITGFLEGVGTAVMNISAPVLDYYLYGNENFNLLGILKVIHTPGHTKGSVCFYSEKYGILFSGDALQQRNGKIVRTPRKIYSEDEEQEEQSVKKLLELDFDRLYSGHHQILEKDAARILKKNNQ